MAAEQLRAAAHKNTIMRHLHGLHPVAVLFLGAVVGTLAFWSAVTIHSRWGQDVLHPNVKQLEYVPPISEQLPEGADRLALELLDSKNRAHSVIESDSSTRADRDFAKNVEEQRTRQLEAQLQNTTGFRIVNGRPADIKDFPFQVALVWTGPPTPLRGFFCGGALIQPQWVLTAAHCLTRNNKATDFHVFVGSSKLSNGGKIIELAPDGLIRHRMFNASTGENDLALLHLAAPAEGLQPIELADFTEEGDMIAFSRNASISGWGVTKEGGTPSDDLVWANVPLVDVQTCSKDYSHLPPNRRRDIKDGMFCAGNGEADACQGDSGGPLTMWTRKGAQRLEGIVSWGEGCARAEYPGVYTRVPKYVDWIRACIAGNCGS